ncbi:hypothetical protein HPT27_09010 [Permianibacter sp. IMCC34836]|nr:hypothetical protein [Permianibacter fluminis]NQD37164.1 hypothetical protein [Permianibacter fluminis]
MANKERRGNREHKKPKKVRQPEVHTGHHTNFVEQINNNEQHHDHLKP